MSEERLQNILSHAGICSRRKAVDIIAAGRVTVDGLVVREAGARVGDGALVKVDGKPLAAPERKRTIVLYKPVGVLSTLDDPFGGKTVADVLRESGGTIRERLVPVGRLDKDSEGLLLMSNDGDLVNHLTHPRYEHRKEYIVKVAGRWSAEKLAVLRSPLTLDDGYTIRPVPVEVIRLGSDNTALLRFVLGEGRKRQIRKMCSAAHLVVLELKRVAVGAFALPEELRPGEWRDLTDEELRALTGEGGRRWNAAPTTGEGGRRWNAAPTMTFKKGEER